MMNNMQALHIMTKKYSDAATAYRDTYVSNMSGFEIVVELYKGIIQNIEQAKRSYESGRLDEVCASIEKTNRILVALQTHLDFDKGGEAALFLNEFYNGIFASLAQIFRKPNPEEEFDQILAHIQPVYEIWCKHAEQTSA